MCPITRPLQVHVCAGNSCLFGIIVHISCSSHCCLIGHFSPIASGPGPMSRIMFRGASCLPCWGELTTTRRVQQCADMLVRPLPHSTHTLISLYQLTNNRETRQHKRLGSSRLHLFGSIVCGSSATSCVNDANMTADILKTKTRVVTVFEFRFFLNYWKLEVLSEALFVIITNAVIMIDFCC